MTNKQAIEHIKRHMKVHFTNEPNAILITEALCMAIKALEDWDKLIDALNIDRSAICTCCNKKVPIINEHGICPTCEERAKEQFSAGVCFPTLDTSNFPIANLMIEE